MLKGIKIVVVLLLMASSTYSQSLTIKSIESRLVTHQGVEFVGVLNDVKNDHYSFSNWSNEGVLYMNDAAYSIANLNFNASSNAFESRIDRKKVFAYKNSTVDSVSINNRIFKKIDDYFYEVLGEKENFYLLKKHDIKYTEGAINRMHLQQADGFTSLVYRYLIKIDDDFKTVSLNKKSILGLLESEQDQDSLSDFVKKNKLSFKREGDVSEILEYLFLDSGMKVFSD